MSRRVAVPPERIGRWLDGFAERHGAVTEEWHDDGVRLAGADGATARLSVPFPPLAGAGRRELVEHMRRPRRVGVLLVRRGGYAVGVFAGTELVASKVGSRYVQGTTKAGGWSQQRFARRRANQAQQAYAAAADAACAVVLPHLAGLHALVCGGDRAAVDAVLADPRLAALAGLPRGPLLPVPDPRLAVLRAMPEQFRAVTVTLDP